MDLQKVCNKCLNKIRQVYKFGHHKKKKLNQYLVDPAFAAEQKVENLYYDDLDGSENNELKESSSGEELHSGSFTPHSHLIHRYKSSLTQKYFCCLKVSDFVFLFS